MAARPGGLEKFAANFLDEGALLFIEGAPEHVRPPGRQAGERFAELQDMFLINHQPIGAPQARFQ